MKTTDNLYDPFNLAMLWYMSVLSGNWMIPMFIPMTAKKSK